MNRVLVIGCAGSGKSTLTQKLSKILNLPPIHLDTYFWKANWVETPNDEWDKVVVDLTMREQWIIDGNYSRTMDIRLKRADLIIYLDMPRWLCMYRIFKRRVMYHKKTRPDMNEGCQERLDLDFVKWVWHYRKRSRNKTLAKLEKIKDQKKVIIARTRKEVEALIEQLKP